MIKKSGKSGWRLCRNFHPDIDPQTIRLMDELGFVSRSIYHMREQSIDEAGLSFAQYGVLMHLFFAEQMGEPGGA